MNFATIRTITRRYIMEATPHNWDNSTLNDCINSGLEMVQKEILKVDPESFLEWTRRDIAANESFYFLPEGLWMPNQVRLKDETTGKYAKLPWKPFDVAETWTGSTVWSRRGRYVALFPTPEKVIVAGLELIFVPTLVLAADGDIPPIPLGLHRAIPYLAKIIALGETYQNFDRDVAMVEKILGDVGTYYTSTQEPLQWRPDIKKALGYAG